MMKQRRKTHPVPLWLLIILACASLPFFTAAWDKAKPAGSDALRDSDDSIRANNTALESALAQDHEFSAGGTNSGKHEVLTMEEEASAGASSTNELHVQAIDGGSGQPEFAITSEDGDELQMTKDGDLYSSDNLVVVGTSTFTGAITANSSITLGAGDDLIGSATSDITFNTNKFTVAGATGNTVIAGTLDVTGNIDPTTYETTNGGFLDEDAMGSDAADKVASQQSIKAYVDTAVGGVISWIKFNSSGTELGGVNAACSKSGGTGVYAVTWDTDYGSANYAVTVTSFSDLVLPTVGEVTAQAETGVTIKFKKGDGTAVDTTAFVIAVGAQ